MRATSSNVRRARPLLGTFVEIGVADAPMPAMEAAVEAAFVAIADVHRLMSFHDTESDVSRLNDAAASGPVAVHPWTFQVLEMAAEMHRQSLGAFDIAVAPMLQRLGLLPGRPDDRPSAAIAAEAGEAIELLPGHRVRFRDPSVRVDLGGIAKGFAVDRAIEVLQAHGMRSGLVNAGGDLAAIGPHPQTIGIRDPRDPGRLMCRVELRGQALASTGGRFDLFESLDATDTAVIDPGTGTPARAVRGATVRASSCMVADALTKVVMIAGERAGTSLEHYRASAIFVSADGDVRITRDWEDGDHNAH